MRIHRFVAAIVLCAASLAVLALPTVEAVQAEVQRGNYAQAEAMMQQVVAAKPGSARAHYVYAEILAHNRRFDQAAAEVARAREADPAIGFTDPTKFAALERLLERERQTARPAASPTVPAMPAARPAPQPAPGTPAWVWVFGLAGIAAIVWAVVSRRQRAATMMPGGAVLAGSPGYGTPAAAPGWAAQPGVQPPAAGGTGLLGVGLAAAGGVAAGMLAERLLHGGHDGSAATAAAAPAGGLVPGMFDGDPDDPAARELEQRGIDFGQGDGWGADGDLSDTGSDDGW